MEVPSCTSQTLHFEFASQTVPVGLIRFRKVVRKLNGSDHATQKENTPTSASRKLSTLEIVPGQVVLNITHKRYSFSNDFKPRYYPKILWINPHGVPSDSNLLIAIYS